MSDKPFLLSLKAQKPETGSVPGKQLELEESFTSWRGRAKGFYKVLLASLLGDGEVMLVGRPSAF